VENWRKRQKISENRQKWLKIGLTYPLIPPDRLPILNFPRAKLIGYALGYSILIVNQIYYDSNVENWRKRRKISENSQKWLKIGFTYPLKPPDRPWIWIFPGQQLWTNALEYSKLIVNQIKYDSNVENWRKRQKITENRQKWLKMGFTHPLIPPGRPWFWIFPGQQLYTYALGYSKLIINQI